MYNNTLRQQTLLARWLGLFGIIWLAIGYLSSTDWMIYSGIMFAIMGFILFFVFHF